MSKFTDRFFEWQNYVHYLLLTIGISWIANYIFLGNPVDIIMGIILYVALFIIDTIVHGIFWFAPKPIRWRD